MLDLDRKHMMRSWRIKLALALVATTLVLNGVHYLIFRDAHHLAIYGLHEIAMMPLEVLIVTMLLHSLLERQAHSEKMSKLHMVIGAFFSEVGTDLLKHIASLDETLDVREHFLVDHSWDAKRYQAAKKAALDYDYGVHAALNDLHELRDFLAEKRPFLLGLLQNPNLLEHESFTDALWAITHVAEELGFRDLSAELSEADAAHVDNDIKRAYAALAVEWLDYARHLQRAYPYLFALAARTNPLSVASPEVGQATN